jgi:hypothetical protein
MWKLDSEPNLWQLFFNLIPGCQSIEPKKQQRLNDVSLLVLQVRRLGMKT